MITADFNVFKAEVHCLAIEVQGSQSHSAVNNLKADHEYSVAESLNFINGIMDRADLVG